MMKRKLTALSLLLILTGCSLAQPEAADSSVDPFVGFYVTYETTDTSRDAFYDSPYRIEYGSETLNTEYGKLSVPKSILAAEEKDGRFIFPGMDGFRLFFVYQDNGGCISSASDLADIKMNITDTGEGVTHSLSGTLYLGPPQDAGTDWEWYDQSGILTFYRVYESPDGMIYLDGTGNSSNGLGAYRETHTSTETINGETSAVTAEVEVNVKYAPRLENLVVSQFDENNTLLRSDDMALREDMPEVECLDGTTWVLVEEYSAEGIVRTAYSPPGEGEEPACHAAVLLDAEGRGRTAELDIRFPDNSR